MKLGPWTISRTAHMAAPRQERRARIDQGELGSTGTTIFGGLVQSAEYNPELQGVAGYDIYDRMRLGDGQVRAALQVMKLPLLRSEWTLEPASDSAADKEIAEFIEYDLKHMSLSWNDWLRQVLLCLDYGNMLFEKVWELREGMIHLRKLAPRLPRTITKYVADKAGGLAGVEQQATTATSFQTVPIPVEKLLIFVHELEGSNWRGISMLRTAYKHWYFKDGMYRVDAIAKERRGVGVDVGTLKGAVDTPRRSEAETALMSLRAHEKQFVVEIDDEQDGFAYRVEGQGRGGLADSMSSIEHHDLRILRSILAEFLAMGEAGSGSLAMHRDKSSFFLMALGALADLVVDTANSYLIEPWVDMNYQVEEYPKLVYSRLDRRDVKELAEAVAWLMDKGALSPTRETEEALRETLELPPLPDEHAGPPAAGPTAAPGEVDMARRRRRLARRKSSRAEYMEAIGRVDFSILEESLDGAEASIVASVREIQKQQVGKLVQVAGDIFASGQFERVGKVTVPFRSDVADAIYRELQRLYDLGRSSVSRELHAAGAPVALAQPLDPTNAARVRGFLTIRAQAFANLMAARLQSSFIYEVLDQIREGEYNPVELDRRMSMLSEREVVKAAQSSTSESLNLGRDAVARDNASLIEKAIFTSVLDMSTCGPCASADGTEAAVDSPTYEDMNPPYHDCQGGGRCRCVFVLVLKEEEPSRV